MCKTQLWTYVLKDTHICFHFSFSVVFVESKHSPNSCPFLPTKFWQAFWGCNICGDIPSLHIQGMDLCFRFVPLFEYTFEYTLSCVLYWSLRNVLWGWDPFEEEMCYNGHTLIRIVRQTWYIHFYLGILMYL